MKANLPTRARRALYAVAALTFGGSLMGGAAAQQSLPIKSPAAHMFLSGGIGLEDRARLAQHEKEANLKLVFTEPRGSYLAGLDVKVFDRGGAMVIDSAATGPWMLAKLDPGSYKIVASDGQHERERFVTVGPGLRTVQILMPDQGGLTGRTPS